MRDDVFAGQFYEKEQYALEKQITNCFLGKKGPGTLPEKKRRSRVLAAICPHAGYSYSGMCAAWAYKGIAEADFPDVYIILAPSHTGFGSGISLQPFKTPFGQIRIDLKLAELIMRKSRLKENDLAHEEEHAIEVQLPFLQFASADKMHELKIIPIIVSEDIDWKDLGAAIADALAESKKKALIIASSDFTHYGHFYRYLPFTENAQEGVYSLDGTAIQFIKSADPDGLLKYIRTTGATICGALPIAVLLTAVTFSKAELLQYYTSGEITNDYKNTVSYASMIFR
jgi:AmmeMemoRadiSam system protein B